MGRPYKPFEPGSEIGTLTVLSTVTRKGGYASECLCRCGKTVVKQNGYLRHRAISGCGAGCPYSVVALGRESRRRTIKASGKTIEYTASPHDEAKCRQTKAIKMRAAGKSTTEIAERIGISRERVCQFLRPLGMNKRIPKAPDPELLAKIVELNKDGYSSREIADMLKIAEWRAQKAIQGQLSDDDRHQALRRRKTRERKEFESVRLKFLRLADDWSPYLDQCVFSCACGTQEFTASFKNVESLATKSCGCLRQEYIDSLISDLKWDTKKHEATNKAGRNWGRSAKATKAPGDQVRDQRPDSQSAWSGLAIEV